MTKFPVSIGSKTSATPDLAAESDALASSALTSAAHALTAHRLAKKYAASMANNGALSLTLATRLWDPEVWSESMQLQAAIPAPLAGAGPELAGWLHGAAAGLRATAAGQHHVQAAGEAVQSVIAVRPAAGQPGHEFRRTAGKYRCGLWLLGEPEDVRPAGGFVSYLRRDRARKPCTKTPILRPA